MFFDEYIFSVQTDCIARISPEGGNVLGWILLQNLRFCFNLFFFFFAFGGGVVVISYTMLEVRLTFA